MWSTSQHNNILLGKWFMSPVVSISEASESSQLYTLFVSKGGSHHSQVLLTIHENEGLYHLDSLYTYKRGKWIPNIKWKKVILTMIHPYFVYDSQNFLNIIIQSTTDKKQDCSVNKILCRLLRKRFTNHNWISSIYAELWNCMESKNKPRSNSQNCLPRAISNMPSGTFMYHQFLSKYKIFFELKSKLILLQHCCTMYWVWYQRKNFFTKIIQANKNKQYLLECKHVVQRVVFSLLIKNY